MNEDPKEYEARVQRSRDKARPVIATLSETDPAVRSKSSPIAAMLEPYADEIWSAIDRGWSPGAIARKLGEAHVEFSVESIRLRIGKMFRATDGVRSSNTTKRTPAEAEAARSRKNAARPVPLRPAPQSNATLREAPPKPAAYAEEDP